MNGNTLDQRSADFNQLQREYRHMELNRRAYAEESQQLLRKQQMAIDKLRRDNEALKTELAVEMRHHAKPAGGAADATTRLADLQDQGDRYTQQIELERRNIRVMEEQIQLMREKILHQRKHMGGVNAARENQQMVQKQVRILENRLDKALVKFNEALARNKQLREQIDDLRRERVVFDTIYRKLEKELQERKRQMANIIELSNLSYEHRDNFQMEIAAIEQANRKEHADFEEQMLELGKLLEEAAAGGPGGGRGGRKGGAGGGGGGGGRLGGGGGGAAGGGEEEGPAMGDMTIDEENRLKKRVNKGAWGIVKDKVDIQVSMERVQNFEEAFNKIKAATGINDIDELVRTFIKHEDQNFSLFNYVNEQTNEAEKLEEAIQALKDEEARHAQESGEDVHQHKQLLKDLEARLQATEAAAEKYEQRCADAQATLEALKRGLRSLFERVAAHGGPGAAASGGGGGGPGGGGGGGAGPDLAADTAVTEANMMHCLGLVEQHTNEVMRLYAAAQAQQKERQLALIESGAAPPDPELLRHKPTAAMVSVLGAGPSAPMGKDLLHVNPPKLEDYSSDEGSDEEGGGGGGAGGGGRGGGGGGGEEARPLTREELKARTLNRIQRKNARDLTKTGGKKIRRSGV